MTSSAATLDVRHLDGSTGPTSDLWFRLPYRNMSTDGSISNIQDGRDSESDVGVAIDILLGDLASSPDLIHTVASGSDLGVSHNHDTRHDGWQGDDRKGKAIDGPLDFTETVNTSDSDGQNNDADCTGIHASALTDRPDLAHPPTVGAVCHQVSNLPRGNRKRPITVTGDPIGTPHANDVLLGRGRMIANHPGNVCGPTTNMLRSFLPTHSLTS